MAQPITFSEINLILSQNNSSSMQLTDMSSPDVSAIKDYGTSKEITIKYDYRLWQDELYKDCSVKARFTLMLDGRYEISESCSFRTLPNSSSQTDQLLHDPDKPEVFESAGYSDDMTLYAVRAMNGAGKGQYSTSNRQVGFRQLAG